MRSPIAPIAVLTLTLLLAVHVSAQTGANGASSLLEGATQARPLGLDEAIALGLQNNLDVEVNRYSPHVSQLDSEAAWGAYDVNFASDIGYESSVPPTAVESVVLVPQYRTRGNASLGALVPYVGAQVGVTFEGSKLVGASPFRNLNPQLQSTLGLTATIPLMKGLIWNEPWTQVKTSRIAYRSALDTFESSVMDTVQSIIGSYWDLVAAKEQLRVAEKSLESTTALLDQTRTQYEVGVVSKVEVVQADAGVANSEFNLIVARNDYHNAQDNLIAAVLGDRLRAATMLMFDPTDNPEYHAVEPVDLDRAVLTAFDKRPEVSAAQNGIEQSELQLRFARNQRLPQFDIEMGYRTTGVAGPANPDRFTLGALRPITVGSSFGNTFDSYFRGPYEYSAKGVFTIPIPNTAARRGVSKAQLQLRKAGSELTRLKQGIIVTVRAAARGLLASAQGVEAAERRRGAAAEQLRAERIRLEHGESTPFDVLQRERDLVEAESQKIAALKAFRVSQVALDRAEGTILESRNIVIDHVRELR